MMMSQDLFSKFVSQLPDNWRGKTVVVGFSGGLDSVVLLHLLCHVRAEQNWKLNAIHVHHGLNEQADAWLAFCQKLCADWQVNFIAERVQVHATHLGLEATARQARYAVFAQQAADVLALAHHLDDQLETFFLAALRGGGVRALAAMPTQRMLSPATLRLPENDGTNGFSGSLNIGMHTTVWRPLLPFSRCEISHYAQQHGLQWVEDSSNADTHYLRNWLRHDWLPEMRQRVPHAAEQLSGSIAQLQDDLAILDEVVMEDEQRVCDDYGHLNVVKWRQLSSVRRRQQLLRFAQKNGLGTPTRHSIGDFERVLLQANTAQWSLAKGRAVLYRGTLFAWLPDYWLAHWLWCTRTFSGSLNELAAILPVLCKQKLLENDTNEVFHLRSAQRNDVFVWKDGHRKAVFRFLREQGVPSFMRPYWPVLFNQAEQCVAVANLWGNLLYCDDLETFRLPEN